MNKAVVDVFLIVHRTLHNCTLHMESATIFFASKFLLFDGSIFSRCYRFCLRFFLFFLLSLSFTVLILYVRHNRMKIDLILKIKGRRSYTDYTPFNNFDHWRGNFLVSIFSFSSSCLLFVACRCSDFIFLSTLWSDVHRA